MAEVLDQIQGLELARRLVGAHRLDHDLDGHLDAAGRSAAEDLRETAAAERSITL